MKRNNYLRRDNNLDFIRAIAVISIIFIHTVCKSGTEYVPLWMLDIALIIDVPLFIFISGMTFHYLKTVSKNLDSLIKIWYKWVIFIVIYFLYVLIFRFEYFSLKNIIKALFFSIDVDMPLTIISQSLWFMPMYFIVSILASIIITKCQDKVNMKKILLINFILYMMYLYYFKNVDPNISKILMYTLIYLLGYYLYDKQISTKKYSLLLIVIISLNVLLAFFGFYDFIDMFNAKFAFDFTYFAYCLISLVTAWYLLRRIKIKDSNKILYIGKNALSFYFAQGVSSSLIYHLTRRMNFFWPLKLFVAFIANLLLALVIGIILNEFTNYVYNKLKFKGIFL